MRNIVYKLPGAKLSSVGQKIQFWISNPTHVITHFEKLRNFQSALNLGPSQRTLKKKPTENHIFCMAGSIFLVKLSWVLRSIARIKVVLHHVKLKRFLQTRFCQSFSHIRFIGNYFLPLLHSWTLLRSYWTHRCLRSGHTPPPIPKYYPSVPSEHMLSFS